MLNSQFLAIIYGEVIAKLLSRKLYFLMCLFNNSLWSFSVFLLRWLMFH